jgi:O-methyltransferase
MTDDRGRLVAVDRFEPAGGYCFIADIADLPPGDSADDASGSPLVLFEDGIGLGPPHAVHDLIRQKGGGRYSHWHQALYLSSSDNTDPRANGRRYQVYVPPSVRGQIERAIGVLASLSTDYTSEQAYAAVERCLGLLYPQAKIGEDLKSFWNDAAFIATYRALAGDNYRALERKYAVYNLVRSLYWLTGDVAECGVYTGASAYFMALASVRCGARRDLHLFDSFAGLSPPAAVDGSYWQAGDLACTEETARQNLAEFANVLIYPGWIPSRFSAVADRRFCFVHIDVDIYQPTRDSLAFFFPRLQPGGMLVCDDYGFDSCPGARRAMDEFFADRPERIIHLPTGQGLVIKLGSSPGSFG